MQLGVSKYVQQVSSYKESVSNLHKWQFQAAASHYNAQMQFNTDDVSHVCSATVGM